MRFIALLNVCDRLSKTLLKVATTFIPLKNRRDMLDLLAMSIENGIRTKLQHAQKRTFNLITNVYCIAID